MPDPETTPESLTSEDTEGDAAASEQADLSDAQSSEELTTALTDDELAAMQNAYHHWTMKGYPERAKVLWECIQQGRRAPANLLMLEPGGVRPETSVDPSTIEAPPRVGPDASAAAWKTFIKKTVDIEPEIVDRMSRKDLIAMAESKGIIEKEAAPKPAPKSESTKPATKTSTKKK